MRNFQFILFGLLVTTMLCGQSESIEYEKFLGKQFSNEFSDLGNFSKSIFDLDFSELWTLKALNIDPDFFNPIKPEPLGYIGDNYQRLYIHFTEVKKASDRQYIVIGKTMVRDNICDFSGQLIIRLAREFTTPFHEGADYTIDPRTIRKGVLVGTYELFEDSTQSHVGIFQGSFVSSFYISPNGEMNYNSTQIFSDNYINNQFTGTWKEYAKENVKKACWGDYRIPNSGDLDIGAAGFSPADKYLGYGWQSYREAYYSNAPDEEARKKEEEKWWK